MTGQPDVKCVLVVEDEKELLDLWVEVIRGRGYRAVGVSSAADALLTMEHLTPDLILLDILMPPREPDGLEFLDRLKRKWPTLDVPVLIVSALGDAINMDAARRLGVRGVSSKPIDPDALLEQIEGVLRRR